LIAEQERGASVAAVLHVISDRQNLQIPLAEALESAARGGPDVIQIREKRMPAAEIYAFCSVFRSVLEGIVQPPQLFVNDRVDIAIATPTNGVHLAAKSLPIRVAKSTLSKAGWRGVIGISVHNLGEALAAEKEGADYITFGHIFASESHKGQPPRGLIALERVVDAVEIPVIAIGGITPLNVAPVLSTGCSGVAVIGAVMHQKIPYDAVQKLREQINKSTTTPKYIFPNWR
jgi:thiamine-phosphate diphosphorylase